jgi:hypothetical protein
MTFGGRTDCLKGPSCVLLCSRLFVHGRWSQRELRMDGDVVVVNAGLLHKQLYSMQAQNLS